MSLLDAASKEKMFKKRGIDLLMRSERSTGSVLPSAARQNGRGMDSLARVGVILL
jgi:hypothetical protein